jgi:hydrogenase nickel incorporation protein HypA/HybF
MHELAICQALLSEVRRAAGADAGPVVRIVIRVGALAGVEPRLLERAFDIARGGTIAATAELAIETIPVRVECRQCHGISEVAPNRLICSHCGAWSTRLVGGDELVLQRLEFSAAAARDPAPRVPA